MKLEVIKTAQEVEDQELRERQLTIGKLREESNETQAAVRIRQEKWEKPLVSGATSVRRILKEDLGMKALRD